MAPKPERGISKARPFSMLIQFTVENISCFKEEATLSLVASKDDTHPNHLIKSGASTNPNLVKASAIYGANGHGKSRLVDAIAALKLLVTEGIRENLRYDIPYFKLDKSMAKNPSKLTVNFRINSRDFEYGLSFYGDRVNEEWLFATDENGKEQLIYERVVFAEENGNLNNKFRFGKYLTNVKSPESTVSMSSYLKVIGRTTKMQQTFLRESVERGVNILSEVYNWFKYTLVVISADSSYSPLYRRARDEKDFLTLLSNFFVDADVGAKELRFDELVLNNDFFDNLPQDAADQILKGVEEGESVELGNQDGSVFSFHKNERGEILSSKLASVRHDIAGEEVIFDMSEESSGTRRLLDLIPILSSSGRERVYILDELDRKLHPLLAKKLIETFLSSQVGQIIYTTHNTFLLDLSILRRDEIWFVQKKQSGQSEIYSLSDLKIRPDLDVRKGYLNGRFGAIPFSGNVKDLGWLHNQVSDH